MIRPWGYVLVVWMGSLPVVAAADPATSVAATGVAATGVSKDEAGQWLRWTSPLPKQISIQAKRVLSLDAVRVRVQGPADDRLQLAAQQLREILKTKDGGASGFEIVLGVCDEQGRLEGLAVPGAAGLAQLPNREQSYAIAPLGDDRLALVGLDPRGVSYAARTLGQLLTGKAANGKVEMPLARVTDWPDLGERGLWWFSPAFDDKELDWYADVKLNHLEILAALRVEKGKPATATIDAKAVDRCRLRAIKMIPAVVHLEQLGGTGIFDVYPETRGTGKFPDWASVICFSQPATKRVFDEWLTALARTVQSDDVMVWFSENDVYCKCEKCKPIEQFQHEMQVVVHAFREAQKVRPKLRLRLLLTQGTYRQNITLLKTAPKDVGITYYDGGRTYTVARQPMVYPAMREVIQGRWFGCYPTLSGTWYTDSPFAAAAYMKERMSELHEVKAVSLAGFAPPSLRVNEFSLSAAAEFAWNSGGREPREFVLAWATRHRLPDPEKVAQWWEHVEEPQRDLYISNLTSQWFWPQVANSVAARQAAKPGAGFLAGFPKEGRLEADIASVRSAVSIAESIPDKQFLHEARYTLAVLEAARASRDLTVRLAGRKTLAEADQREAAALMEQIYLAFEQAGEAISAWDRGLQLYPGQKHVSGVGSVLKNFQKVQSQLVETARKLGLEAPFLYYVRQRIGSWQTGTFPVAGNKVDHRIDVTDLVKGPGVYVATFEYTKGMEALEMDRVALVARLPDGKEQEVAVDAHSGRTGAWNVQNSYRLALKQYDPQARYTLVARVGVSASQRDPQKRTSQGDIYWQRLRDDKP